MKSIRSVYKVGHGPSSSHTVGPYNAAMLIKNRYPDCDRIEVTLYGSLAYTGEGHGTGKAIRSVLPDAEIRFDTETKDLPFPNTMLFRIFKAGEETDSVRIFSIGGGSIKVENETSQDEFDVYPHSSFGDMLRECAEDGLTLMQLIDRYETPGVRDYLRGIWHAMEACVERGLKHEGILPGGLNVSRKAKILFTKRCYNESSDVTMNRLIASYAYAASEENASEEIVVTAPTCGSCGVIPSVFYYMAHDRGFPENEIIEALAVAGLIGNVIRTNASISGAECGCQAEIGSACSMAAGGLAYLYGLDNSQIEYAAEVAMEHHLGLTCDPVHGLVQIPCIERNAVAAMRAISAVNISRFLAETRKISFDDIIATMYQTGKDMDERYKETSHGGLAALYASKNTD
ncbi:MAG: L-serine ammonia-lyase, iron-sulfur-dependent, subunit alpha [Oscillospiraceae bacterium]|nr:L-serine ammonia-lyase, iron-sulfur-dependent, subunit alpha [Oscillospiraceae bacterium]MBQ5343266.1 L-serine ammonia-lyase, iron-sulfur-dependent, subunit alpha [Oscillospiraceae bacterium]